MSGLFFVACAFSVDGSDFQNVQTQRLWHYPKIVNMVARWGYVSTLLGECTLKLRFMERGEQLGCEIHRPTVSYSNSVKLYN